MMNIRVRTALASAVALGALALAAPAYAEALPTSSTAATSTWRVMHPSTFAGTQQSALDQCLKDAALDAADLLTPEKCEIARQKFASGDYKVVMVQDGVVHDYMNARRSVMRNAEKATGRSDRALLLDLGDGVFMYWYTGVPNQSCNNVAFSIVKKSAPPLPSQQLVPPAPPAPPVSYMLQMPQVVTPTPSLVVGGIVSQLNDCCCESFIVSSPINVTGGFSSTTGGFIKQ